MVDDDGNDGEVDLGDFAPPTVTWDLQGGLESISVGEIHRLLGNARRRRLLASLADRPEDTVPVDEIIDVVAAGERPDPGPATHRERVAIDLHHVHLPSLADHGVIDFDPVDGTVQYDAPDALSTMLDLSIAIEGSSTDEGA